MADTLVIFGDEFNNVAGIKATDDNGNTITYTKDGGGGNDFIVTLTYNSTSQLWEPDKTYAEIQAAVIAEKRVITYAHDEYMNIIPSYCDTNFISYGFGYCVETWNTTGDRYISTWYYLDGTGIIEDGTTEFAAPATFTTKTITTNGTYNAWNDDYVDGYSEVTVNVPSGTPTLQSKTAMPTESQQTISPDSGYDGLSSVTVGAVSSTYVGTGITRRSSTDLTASGATVSVPAGYYESAASKNVTSGSATAPASISGTSATVSTGTNTLTLSKTVSVTPSVSAGYVTSGTAGNSSVSLTASVTTQAAQTIHPSTSDQSIASGRYLTGAQTIKAVTLSNLTAANIKSGVTVTVGDSTDSDCVASVTGTYSGGSSKNMQAYIGYASRTANSYGATSVTLTVAKTGTYKISWCAWRGSSSGTMGTNLHIGSTAESANHQTWTGTYGQCITLTNQSLTQGTVLTLYATSGNNSRTIYVGNLIIEEE